MNKNEDFIIEDGVLKQYIGNEKSVIIPDTVKIIGKYAFCRCASVESIKVILGVEKVDSCAFNECTNLKKIEISKSLTCINIPSFSECENLTDIIVDNENDYYLSENGVLYTKDKKTLVYYPNGKKESQFSVPNGVTTIGKCAFMGCKLKSIKLPNSITTISHISFAHSESIEKIEIQNGVTLIEDHAFANCPKITSVELPSSVTNIGKLVFFCCQGLKTIKIPKNCLCEDNWNLDCKAEIEYY